MLVSHSSALRPDRPYNPEVHALRFGLFRVRSPLLAESLLFSIPGGTEMVHFPPLPSPAYVFSRRYGGITRRGFPHSDIPGSKLICSSPRLIAAYRVLHRLPAPRHSPYALSSLNIGIKTDPGTHAYRAPGPVLLPTLYALRALFVDQKKLPFAGYSVVKEQDRGLRPRSNLMVENTGIEPVTSWLQTRRSPS